MPRDRTIATELVKTLVAAFPDGYQPGLSVVILVHECEDVPGALEIDASVRGGGCYTEAGRASLAAFGDALRGAVRLAADSVPGTRTIDRRDIGGDGTIATGELERDPG